MALCVYRLSPHVVRVGKGSVACCCVVSILHVYALSKACQLRTLICVFFNFNALQRWASTTAAVPLSEPISFVHFTPESASKRPAEGVKVRNK